MDKYVKQLKLTTLLLAGLIFLALKIFTDSQAQYSALNDARDLAITHAFLDPNGDWAVLFEGNELHPSDLRRPRSCGSVLVKVLTEFLANGQRETWPNENWHFAEGMEGEPLLVRLNVADHPLLLQPFVQDRQLRLRIYKESDGPKNPRKPVVDWSYAFSKLSGEPSKPRADRTADGTQLAQGINAVKALTPDLWASASDFKDQRANTVRTAKALAAAEDIATSDPDELYKQLRFQAERPHIKTPIIDAELRSYALAAALIALGVWLETALLSFALLRLVYSEKSVDDEVFLLTEQFERLPSESIWFALPSKVLFGVTRAVYAAFLILLFVGSVVVTPLLVGMSTRGRFLGRANLAEPVIVLLVTAICLIGSGAVVRLYIRRPASPIQTGGEE